MPRKPTIDFDDLKARADLRTVLHHYDGLGWISMAKTARGEQIMIRCPFHDDRKPSLSINLTKGVWNCKGCDCSGNVLDFVQQIETVNGTPLAIRAAAERLAEICNLPLGGALGSSEPRRATKSTDGRGETRSKTVSGADGAPRRKKPAMKTDSAPNKPLSTSFLQSFQQSLVTDERLTGYLEGRGFDAQAVVEAFDLAYQTGGKIMRERIVIPIRDVGGHVLAYAGRWAGDDAELPEHEGKYKLPKAEHFRVALALYNLHRAVDHRHITVVEGYFGAMRLDLLGLPTVALMGNSISDEQIDLLVGLGLTGRDARYRLEAITVMLDGGEQSEKLTDRLCGNIARRKPPFRVRALMLPGREQPDTIDRAWLEQEFPSLTRQSA